MKILFWDIDGTLLRTAKAGLYAFQQAIAETTNTQFDFNTIKTSGMTDYYIAYQAIHSATGREPALHEICDLIEHYEKALPSHLASRQGYITPSVKEILADVQNRPDYISLLLTGNTAFGAKTKLTYYGIDSYFDFTASAFCNNYYNRTEISNHALSIVKKHYPAVDQNDIFVIGDTPNDINCGKAIGARTIAVATGAYSLEELISHSPWWAVPTLPSAEEFIQNISQ